MAIKTNLISSCDIFLFIFLLLVSASSGGSPESATTTIPTTQSTVKATENDVVESLGNPLPTAAKLVRFRRQPPITVIKHIVRSSKRSKPRRRIKRPKIRYGPPSYIYEDQSSYFKPQYTPSIEPEANSFSLDEFSSLNLNAADFELPSTSYDTQSMELDFYGKAEDENPFQSKPNAHTPAYSGTEFEPSIEPAYRYKSLQRKPHQKYGVPKNLEYATDFYSPSDYSIYNTYQPESIGHPASSSGIQHSTNTGKNSISSSLANAPDEQYNLQSHPFQTDQQPPYGTPNDFSNYDPKLPDSGYNQNYDDQQEPIQPPFDPQPSLPKSYPTQPVSDIEITYSPSYEINLPPSGHTNEDNRQYDSTDSHIQSGNFAEPPQHHQPITHYTPGHDVQPVPGPNLDYVPPSQELPLNPHHKQPPYDFPKSSYEVPIYDPIPFEASTNDEQEYYPPNQFQPHTPSTSLPTTSSPPVMQYTQPHKDNFESPPNDSASQSHGNEVSSKDRPMLQTDASTTSTTKLRRYRKRPRRPLTGATKHILDVPELKEAFEAARPLQYSINFGHHADTEMNASNYVEEKQKMIVTKPNKPTENYFNQESWNPLRIRTNFMSSSKDNSKSITASSSLPTSNSLQSKPDYTKQMRPQLRSRIRPLATASTPSSLSLSSSAVPLFAKRHPTPKTASISIEKSQSKSYYDGTLAPSTLKIVNNTYNSRPNKLKVSNRQSVSKLLPTSLAATATQMPHNNDAMTSKRTTKNIFDTTHFKAPQNNNLDYAGPHHPSLFGLNLPKNHKLY